MKRFGYFFKLINSGFSYTFDKKTISLGTGVYKHDEWNDTRKISWDFYSMPTVKNYLRLIFDSTDIHKISAAASLNDNFDFSRYTTIGDIGGVPFSQAWVIGKLNPDLRFILTDYDMNSIKAHSKCPPMENSRLDTLDVKTQNFQQFHSCDLLMMWGVDSALEDGDLTRIFEYCKSQGIPLLMASIKFQKFSAIGIARSVRGKLLSILGRARMHGVFRNELYLRELCKQSDVTFESIGIIGLYHIFKIN